MIKIKKVGVIIRKNNIAIVGATGLVGRMFLVILEELDLQFNNLYLFASKRSKGKIIKFKEKEYEVIELKEDNIVGKDIDYALFSAGSKVSLEYAPIFAKHNAIVIDNSSAFRMDGEVPLVVPEVNPLDAFKSNGIIANPNCSTIQCVLPLKVLDDLYKLESVRYSTYQAVSGSGLAGIEDLKITTNGDQPKKYPHPIYNNCLPHIDDFVENGYTKEEIKMINETRKILGIEDLKVTATCVRVPVYNGHSVEIHVELKNDFDIEDIRKGLSNIPGIIVIDDVYKNLYPFATIASGTNDVYVGRIRRDISNPKCVHIFCVADNVRKGAATNTVQICKLLIERGVYNG